LNQYVRLSSNDSLSLNKSALGLASFPELNCAQSTPPPLFKNC
jgi:hypothetical protein